MQTTQNDDTTAADQINDFARAEELSGGTVTADIIAKRYARLPEVDPPTMHTTLVTIPLADGRIEWETVQGLLATINHQWRALINKCYTSNVGLARNELANAFLQTPFEWLVMIDGDTVFTPQDLIFLLDGNDYAVNGPYAQKDDEAKPVVRGLGFTRVHRSVFELLVDEEIVVPFTFQGKKMHDFFIQGATGTGGYLGEDSGFWWLLSQIGVFPRIETRVNLQHIGKYRYTIPAHHMAELRERIAAQPKR